MANEKSDKPVVRTMIIVCVAAILIFHFAWFNQLTVNMHKWLFVVGDIVMVALFGYCAGVSYKQADDPNKEYYRYLVVFLTVALCAWAGGWAAYQNELVR